MNSVSWRPLFDHEVPRSQSRPVMSNHANDDARTGTGRRNRQTTFRGHPKRIKDVVHGA